jgi:hypothetical protein
MTLKSDRLLDDHEWQFSKYYAISVTYELSGHAGDHVPQLLDRLQCQNKPPESLQYRGRKLSFHGNGLSFGGNELQLTGHRVPIGSNSMQIRVRKVPRAGWKRHLLASSESRLPFCDGRLGLLGGRGFGLIAFSLSRARSGAFAFAVIAGVAPTAMTMRLAALYWAGGSATRL